MLGFAAGVFQHRAGKHIFGFRVGWHAEARHIDAYDAHSH